jgi:DNA-binding XRE family transcriptional regulator
MSSHWFETMLSRELETRSMSLDDLSVRLGVSKQTAYFWARGLSRPSFDVFEDICRLFDWPHPRTRTGVWTAAS